MLPSRGGPAEGWHYGIDPALTGLTIGAITREAHSLGEALRIVCTPEDDPDFVHVQWYISTEISPWAMWTSCPRSELPRREAVIRDLVPYVGDADQPFRAASG